MKIVLPMAGRGSRYSDHGFQTPKPLIEVGGKPMVLWALDGLLDMPFSELILVVLEAHEEQYGVSTLVQNYLETASLVNPGLAACEVKLITIPEVTEGQLCTVLAAKAFINTTEDVLIAASDTYIRSSLGKDIQDKPEDCTGIISVINLPGEQWSFARTDATGRVLQVAEKVRISDYASNGLYYFSHGSSLVTFGEAMIQNNERTRGEFFVIPVYQKMIEAGQLVQISSATEMWDLGTPVAKEQFEQYLATL